MYNNKSEWAIYQGALSNGSQTAETKPYSTNMPILGNIDHFFQSLIDLEELKPSEPFWIQKPLDDQSTSDET